MASLKYSLVCLICLLAFPCVLKAQLQDNKIITINEVYNQILINKVSNPKLLINPTSNTSLSKNNPTIQIINSNIVKNIVTDIKSKWEYLIFNEIIINKINETTIMVSGSLSGKNIEEGLINYQDFQHQWIIDNGVVIKFLE